MFEIAGLVALGLVEVKLILTAHMGAVHIMLKVWQVPGALHCLRLLMSRVKEGSLFKVTFGRICVSFILSHHKSALLDSLVLVIGTSLKECVHFINLVAITVLLLVHLLRVSYSCTITALSHFQSHASLLKSRKILMSILVTLGSLSIWCENRLLGINSCGTGLLNVLSAIGPALNGFVVKISLKARWG